MAATLSLRTGTGEAAAMSLPHLGTGTGTYSVVAPQLGTGPAIETGMGYLETESVSFLLQEQELKLQRQPHPAWERELGVQRQEEEQELE